MEGLYSFFSENSIYIVLIITLTIWLGIFIYLWNNDKRLRKIEEEIKES